MKTRMKRWIVLFVLSIIAVASGACSNKKSQTEVYHETEMTSETAMETVTGETSEAKEKPEIRTIKFAVPEIEYSVDPDHVRKCNVALLEDGYPYQLSIKKLDYEDYQMILQEGLKKKRIDVAFLGLGDESNSVYNVISSGMLLNLDDILSTDNGKALYEAFPETLWETVKCNGHYYSIPNCTAQDQGIYAVFNRDYISDEDIEKWDGSLEGIYEMVKKADWDDETAPRFQYLLSGFDFAQMIRCEIRDGLLYDYESKKIENPLESERFIGYLRTLDRMKQDGYIADSVSFHYNTSYKKEAGNLEEGKFLVALDVGEPQKMYFKENLTIKTLPSYIPSRINGSIGIAKDTEDPDAVVEFLGILYGNEKYANILMYGKENVDYTLVDGFAVNEDREDPDFELSYLTGLILDLFINIHPVKGDIFAENRKEAYFSFYDNTSVTPFIGFEADTSGNIVIRSDIEMFLRSLKDQPFEEALAQCGEKLKSDGIDEYLKSVQEQWEKLKD